MDVHLIKAEKIAKKALGLFEMAIKGLEETNQVLEKGAEATRTEVVNINQQITDLESKVEDAKKVITQHEEGISKNLRKIEKLKDIFGE